MAKWGEGDPRWIVEERPDATNVNNWHWSEKNATPWSKNRLKELLEGLRFDEGSSSCELTSIKKLEGEATANNRKAKLIFLFEWEIEINFIGRVSGNDEELKGFLEIPNLSDENEASEIDVNANFNNKSVMEVPIRHLIQKKGIPAIQEQLGLYIKELKEEFSKGLILPTEKNKAQVVMASSASSMDKRNFMNKVVTTQEKVDSSASSSSDVKVKMISLTENFKVPPARLFEILTQRELVNAWTNGSASEWNCTPNGTFSLFGGMVQGQFLNIKDNSEIEFTWRLKSFPNAHYARVKFTIKDQTDSTDMEIVAENVPLEHSEDTQNGFTRYYLQSISRTFGFGTRFF